MTNIEKILEKMNYHREWLDHYQDLYETEVNNVYLSTMSYHQGAIDVCYKLLKLEDNFESLSLSNQYYVITKDGGIYI